MTAPYVAFALDDVLANLREPLMCALNRRTGLDWHWHDWTEYKLCERYRATVEDVQRWLVDDAVLEQALPEPHAVECVAAARDAGYRVAVVTARAWHPRGEALTRDWLRTHGLRVDALHLVPIFTEKASTLRALGTVRHYVDDHAGHLHPARGIVHRLHLLDRPWNRSDSALPRIHALPELSAALQADPAQGSRPRSAPRPAAS